MTKTGTINVNDLTDAITIHISITGYKKLRVKVWIGTLLIRLGIRIIGMNVKIIED